MFSDLANRTRSFARLKSSLSSAFVAVGVGFGNARSSASFSKSSILRFVASSLLSVVVVVPFSVATSDRMSATSELTIYRTPVNSAPKMIMMVAIVPPCSFNQSETFCHVIAARSSGEKVQA